MIVLPLLQAVTPLFSGILLYEYMIINESNETIFLTMLTNADFRENGRVISDKYTDDFGGITIRPHGAGDCIKRCFTRGTHMSWNRILTIQPILTTQEGKLMYIAVDGAHLIKLCYETFIMYDADDNIIMTIDDLNENSFVEYKYKYGLALIVTQEMVEAGRRKYTGTTEENKVNLNL
jgi:hypothetical protein